MSSVYAKEEFKYTKIDGVLNMRSKASTDSLIVYQLKNDMKVKVISEGEKWSYISYDGHKGYILKKYLVKKEIIETDVRGFSFDMFGSYTLKRTDDLKEVSFENGIPYKKMMSINQIKERETFPGQILKINDTKRLAGKKIVVDPGHGGNEKGAAYNGAREARETLRTSLKLKRHLESEGAEVVLTVDENLPMYRRIPLAERARTAFRTDADIFVSIHYNSNENPYAKGTETYYNKTTYKGSKNPYPQESHRLANYLQKYLTTSAGTNDLGTKENNYHVLRNNSVPSVLIEVGFLSNEEEAELIQTNAFQEKVAYGITKGIIKYFKK